MNSIFAKAVLGGRTKLNSRKSQETEIGSTTPSSPIKTLDGDFAWQDAAVECMSEPYSKLNSPTGSGKQIIISAAAAMYMQKSKISGH